MEEPVYAIAHINVKDYDAYLGITVPDYPNMFCRYSPNTNIVHGGGI